MASAPAAGDQSQRFRRPGEPGRAAAGPDVVIGEGAAIVLVPADELLDGRPYTPGTARLLTRFLASPEYTRLAAAG
ncbi:hypothetical protein [Micromonospora rhizosphaerae]|uniref:hypothetical protein n=1 Tax=Micromonospora rhizosphaerae TaxID=568872 RepID=UPI00114D2D78|nr:hypothetical protein [Micromonospora rhizosphaerae]